MNKLYNFQQYDLLKGLMLPKRKAYKKARYKKAQIRFSRRNVRNWDETWARYQQMRGAKKDDSK